MNQRQQSRARRDAARRDNKVHYNTGAPCKKGHYSDRWTKTGHCIKCQGERSLKYSRKPEVVAAAKTKRMMKEYGITRRQYDKALTKGCEICGVTMVEGGKSGVGICIDHNHSTGNTRGFLCNHCNRALGLFKDNKEVLIRAKEYLDEYD